ncbi:MAG TPA: transcription-repair coupling factor [Aggregatilineales bacterium]|nr:transcription-repair coupling factor [Anaerolineales bacterium]HRE48698.1 transcription-repair coupling factor [Aggregatilineales bacterium]
MQLHGLLSRLESLSSFRPILTRLAQGQPVGDQRVMRSARPFVAAALANALNRPALILTGSAERAYTLAEQLPVWLPDHPIHRFAEPSAIFYDHAGWNTTTIRGRLAALAAFLPPIGVRRETPPIIVSSAHALMTRTLPPRDFRASSRLIKVGGRADPDQIMRFWLGIGYLPATIVTEPGTFSRRGGIVDLFPIDAESPVRFEFFGDEIERIRTFDPGTQRSSASLESVAVIPARESLPKYAAPAAERLRGWFDSHAAADDSDTFAADSVDLASETAFPTLDFYLPYLYNSATSLLNYLPDEALLIVDDFAALQEAVEDLESQAVGQYDENCRAGLIPPDYPLPYLPWTDLHEAIRARRPLHLGGGMERDGESFPDEDVLGAAFRPAGRFGGQLRSFLDSLYEIDQAVIVSNQAQRLAELWAERGGTNHPVSRLDSPPEGIVFVEGALTEGWTLHTDQSPLHLLTDAEIFGWKRPEPRRRIIQRSVSPESYFADLTAGDYIVHMEYGIGRFVGLQRRSLDGGTREYLALQYANDDMLYVPIHQADRLSRYVGADDAAPTLSRLGSSEWAQKKEAARRAAEEVAKELLDLYARRAAVKGHAFSPDSHWQAELEASFPYLETDDQLRALAEVKADMERPTPMDRLICGDVGYGKTEVALRAAFKAIMDGKQVAVLVPTTILAQQHFNTFSQRFAAFPVKVEMLSRFRTPKEQRAILDLLTRGKIDILIGTHRLLQQDVAFRDLGLLVIDEEQRFGVTHKERLKRMRTEVDVLTMTATPIPRTLYMSLAGIRDISMIQTPPAERLPVITHVGAYDEKLVRGAILREIDRGGQVYFVHNRVMTIDSVADHLRRIVPEARLLIGHGQMAEDELEQVMTTFAGGEADVLLCTTIIESGLDIPNANTIMMDRADALGLAQLYQLRGRVGRGANRAYAYLFYPKGAHLTSDARARLDTIAEQTELGAGYNIAMRDLEIRGAGEFLGNRQSGYIASVGFHLYTQLLSREVARLRAETAPNARPSAPSVLPLPGTAAPITIDLPLPAYVPVSFMSDSAMRLQFYRRLADVTTLAAIDEIQAELTDRFGALPSEVQGLLFGIRVKLLATEAGVGAITADGDQLAIRLPYLAHVDRAGLQRYLGHGVRVSRTAVWLSRAEEGWEGRLLRLLARLPPQTDGAAVG